MWMSTFLLLQKIFLKMRNLCLTYMNKDVLRSLLRGAKKGKLISCKGGGIAIQGTKFEGIK
jgi:hypothetical protein